MPLHYALAGNPNCGKTTLFNALTGSNQYVGNWAGVTVEKKEGKVTHGNNEILMVDLPGIYSLSPYSMEEIVTRNYIIDENPDIIVNIVDATNIERNLYLTLQLAELGKPMVIALNMMDVVEKKGDTIDVAMLSSLLNIRIVPICASNGTGIHKVLHACEHEIKHFKEGTSHIDFHNNEGKPPEIYDKKVKDTIDNIEAIIKFNALKYNLPLRWSAVKLIEGDKPTLDKLMLHENEIKVIEALVSDIETENIDREIIIADQKYKYICKIRNMVFKRGGKEGELTVSDKIDRVVTNKFLAIPLFIVIMGLIFYITFGAFGSNMSELVSNLINNTFSGFIEKSLVSINTPDWAVGLLCDGIIGGVGAVLAFFPQIALLFLFLSFLEDSGYMSRAAFIMDRALHTVGLSGKSFVPMIMGFGCSVPALMSTTALENDKDKRLTAMLVPFMSCSAKMPVYSLFIAAFFSNRSGITVCSIYLIGIVVAIAYAFVLQKTVLKGGHSPFIMELPQYRLPTPKTLGLHLWEKLKDFFTKAGTVLLGASVIIWFLQYFNFSFSHVTSNAESMLGSIGNFISPVFSPLGFGNWQSAVAVFSGLIARESIVSTMGILYGTTATALAGAYTTASAFSMMTFCLLFVPCVAATTTLRRQLGSRSWFAFAVIMQALIAWVITFIVYHFALLITG